MNYFVLFIDIPDNVLINPKAVL